MENATRETVLTRLNRIEGQVRGIARMVAEDRYCIDIITQIAAVRAALHTLDQLILKDHIDHCVAQAFASGDLAEQRAKVAELTDTISRMTR